MVNLMTLHSAKGLEFDTVFLPGWEEGLFPSQRSMDENGLAGLEEERRLAYVGMTRARERALVSFAANRRIHGQWQASARSRFVDELPADADRGGDRTGARPGAGWAAVAAAAPPWGTRLERGDPRRRPKAAAPPLVIEHARRRGAAWKCARSAVSRSATASSTRNSATASSRSVEDNKLEIAFDKADDKKVMDAFVERA